MKRKLMGTILAASMVVATGIMPAGAVGAEPPAPIFMFKWGSYGSGDGQFAYPQGVAVDASGVVYVADPQNNRIQKFTSAGVFVTKWGSSGSNDGQFNYPTGIALDGSGNVYVAEVGNHRIQKFTCSGTFLTKWGSSGTNDGQFYLPGYAAIGTGRIFVVDSNNHRIQVFDAPYSVIVGARDNPPSPPASQLVGVQIGWSKTGGPGLTSGTTATVFPLPSNPGGSATLTASRTYNSGAKWYVFRQWRVGAPTVPPTALPEQPLNEVSVTFATNSDMRSVAVYQEISFGAIYQANSINPLGIPHTVWIDLTALPGEPTTPTLVGIPVTFVIDGVNAALSGVSPY